LVWAWKKVLAVLQLVSEDESIDSPIRLENQGLASAYVVVGSDPVTGAVVAVEHLTTCVEQVMDFEIAGVVVRLVRARMLVEFDIA